MLKAGIIGLGRIGAEPSTRLAGQVPNGWLPISHIEALLATENIELKHISDVNLERVKWVSDYYNLSAKEHPDPNTLLKEQPDILTIATRTPERYDLIMQALDNNIKAIVVEKPLANSLKRTSEIIEKVVGNDCILGYGAARRAMGIYQQAKEILNSGEMGELKSITAEFGYTKLLWTLPHAVDLFLFFAGSSEVEYISGHCDLEEGQLIAPNNFDGDPLVETATIKFKNGVIGNILPCGGWNIRLGCTKGFITIHGDGDYIELNYSGKYNAYFTSSKRIENNFKESGICNIYSSISKSLGSNVHFSLITPAEIEMNQNILFGIFQSSLEGGKRLSVSSLNANLYISGRTGNLYA
ncbi:hypothetical protein TH63_02730 [Rufibacter radiotolerans]|uniref:Gfo/Idh/MocA-like oxidoreductase N-terminal domain-containing protein n=1 Tax=Rufibacter radiotolerans TaxID=1379910 RepID=A0A0H4VM15_9BACT|nr:Gfo/Idh/MocA family oxidoreductase [Rufibacter radiotolerans]AKQ44784.1 hypothetical protein TH63_02730 [Rufibacter radiotolerans]